MRERVEDLGRISVLLDNVVNHEMFERIESIHIRPKDFCTWFFDQSQEFKEEFVHCIPYWADDLKEKIYEIREIARGEDILNEKG